MMGGNCISSIFGSKDRNHTQKLHITIVSINGVSSMPQW